MISEPVMVIPKNYNSKIYLMRKAKERYIQQIIFITVYKTKRSISINNKNILMCFIIKVIHIY